MKFLHTADLHLDSPFVSDGVTGSDLRREAQRDVLRRIFDCARTEGCDLILIAGDLFDSTYVTPETQRAVLEILGASPCPVVIAPGNHDPYAEGSFYRRADLPEQVFVFTSTELQAFPFDELKTTVYGYAFTSPALDHSPLNGEAPLPEDGHWHLLCAHGDLSSPISRYAPVTFGDIVRLGIHYGALGHIHQPPEPLTMGNCQARYCGFAEGRSFDECGDGGVLIVTLEEGKAPLVERRILSTRRYIEAEWSVTDDGDLATLAHGLKARIGEFDTTEGTHLRLTLTGAAEPERIGALLADAEAYRGSLASLTLRDRTVPVPNGAALEKDVGLRGALYRALYLSLIDEDPKKRRQAARALQIGLAAIEGRSIPTEETEG